MTVAALFFSGQSKLLVLFFYYLFILPLAELWWEERQLPQSITALYPLIICIRTMTNLIHYIFFFFHRRDYSRFSLSPVWLTGDWMLFFSLFFSVTKHASHASLSLVAAGGSESVRAKKAKANGKHPSSSPLSFSGSYRYLVEVSLSSITFLTTLHSYTFKYIYYFSSSPLSSSTELRHKRLACVFVRPTAFRRENEGEEGEEARRERSHFLQRLCSFSLLSFPRPLLLFF